MNLCDFDAVIVPGAGGPRDPTNITGSLPIWIRNKLDQLAKYYIESECRVTHSIPIITLSAGTYHVKPILDKNGHPITEASAMNLYLREILASDENVTVNIYEECSSYDTVGNAFFLRAIHCEPRNWRKMLIVVNEFHYERVRLIFDWVFSLPSFESEKNYQLDYWVIPDDNYDPSTMEIIDVRRVKEKISLEFVKSQIKRLNLQTWEQFHQWFFGEHDFYRSNNRQKLIHQGPKIEISDPAFHKSY